MASQEEQGMQQDVPVETNANASTGGPASTACVTACVTPSDAGMKQMQELSLQPAAAVTAVAASMAELAQPSSIQQQHQQHQPQLPPSPVVHQAGPAMLPQQLPSQAAVPVVQYTTTAPAVNPAAPPHALSARQAGMPAPVHQYQAVAVHGVSPAVHAPPVIAPVVTVGQALQPAAANAPVVRVGTAPAPVDNMPNPWDDSGGLAILL